MCRRQSCLLRSGGINDHVCITCDRSSHYYPRKACIHSVYQYLNLRCSLESPRLTKEVQMAATIEAAIDQSDTPSPRHQGSSKAPRQVSTEIYTSINSGVIFKRDSARILRWMKCALEDLHIDAIIVASATTLALKYLRRRSLFSLVESLHHNGPAAGDLANNHRQQRVTLGNDVSRPSTSAKAAASDITSSRGMQRFGSQNQRWGRRKINQRAVLISVTCLHLASKYHSVHKESVANFGTRLNPEKVFQLGE